MRAVSNRAFAVAAASALIALTVFSLAFAAKIQVAKHGAALSGVGIACSSSDGRIIINGRLNGASNTDIRARVGTVKDKQIAIAYREAIASSLVTIRLSERRSKRVTSYVFGRSGCGRAQDGRPVVVELAVKVKDSGGRAWRKVIKKRRVKVRPCPQRGERACSNDPGARPADPGAGPTGPGTGDGPAPRNPSDGDSSGGDPPDAPADSCPSSPSGEATGTVATNLLNEASGIAVGRVNNDVLWLHNDSGDSARLFALEMSGRLLGIYTVEGAAARDWEDMAIGPGPDSGVHYLYIGDIGDNGAARDTITIYRVEEPEVSSSQSGEDYSLAGAEALTLQYPDGARDAESLMVDSSNGDIYIVSKRDASSRVYRYSGVDWPAAAQELDYLGELTWGGAVAGDISATAGHVLIKSDAAVYLYRNPGGLNVWQTLQQAPTAMPYTAEPQGESIAFCSQSGYFTVSEGLSQPIYYYGLTL